MLVIDKSLVVNQSIFYAGSAVVSCSCRCLWFVCLFYFLAIKMIWLDTKCCHKNLQHRKRSEL